MIVYDLKELKKLEATRRQPSLFFMGFSLLEMLERVWTEHFNEVPRLPEAFFVDRGPLACICVERSPAVVYVQCPRSTRPQREKFRIQPPAACQQNGLTSQGVTSIVP
jgi:hypothetical protein